MLIATLLLVCFAAAFLGILLARTDGSPLYVAFCVLSPVLLPIWIGMQVGEWCMNMSKRVSATSKSVGALATFRPMRSRALSASASCVASAVQH